jgi:hypothetical protein
MGFRWPEVMVRVWGAVGRGVALERGGGDSRTSPDHPRGTG